MINQDFRSFQDYKSDEVVLFGGIHQQNRRDFCDLTHTKSPSGERRFLKKRRFCAAGKSLPNIDCRWKPGLVLDLFIQGLRNIYIYGIYKIICIQYNIWNHWYNNHIYGTLFSLLRPKKGNKKIAIKGRSYNQRKTHIRLWDIIRE